jgi:hypothetical protein
VDDEVLARLAPLVGVMDAGIDESVLDSVAVNRDRRVSRVLLDDREQVAEEAPLFVGELGAGDDAAVARMFALADARPRSDQRLAATRPAVRAVLVRARAVPVAGSTLTALQGLRRRFALLRYRSPSSYRAVYAR